MTGDGDARRGLGVQMLNVRQSSVPLIVPLPSGLTCAQRGGSVVACSVAGIHERAGCGGFHRRSPTGGAEYGMPRYAQKEPESRPCAVPSSVLTTQDGESNCVAHEARQLASTAAANNAGTGLIAAPS